MTHTYSIHNMHCNGCVATVKRKLQALESVESVIVNLEENSATIQMTEHLSPDQLQAALADTHYEITMLGDPPTPPEQSEQHHEHHTRKPTSSSSSGKYYCPMRCEGDKMYDNPGSCPVCGMDLVKDVVAENIEDAPILYTCPMHPEIEQAGPGSCPKCGMDLVPKEPIPEEEESTYDRLLRKLWISIAFTLPIFLIAMSDMLPDNPLYKIISMQAWNWVQFALSIPVVFYTCWMFFERAWASIRRRSPNMFTLIGMGAGVAWIFSVIGLLFPSYFPEQFTMNGVVHVYFEAATVILTLVLLGQVMEARAHEKTGSAIKALLNLAPNTALRVIDGTEELVSVKEIEIGDKIRVKPGEKIPVDGEIIDGKSTVDESMISGEPIPLSKATGDELKAGTINGNSTLLMKAVKIGSETLLSQIISMVNEASRSRAPIQRIADKISAWFVPIVVLIAVVTFIIWAIFGPQPVYVYALINAIAVLIIACPCALGLATPMSVMVGIGKGAQSGVLIKNAAVLEQLHEVNTLIIDKTGTITEGQPSVHSIISLDQAFAQMTLLQYMASLNKNSEHPLGEAIVSYASANDISLLDVSDFEAVSGMGVLATLNGKQISLGNTALMNEVGADLNREQKDKLATEQAKGRTVSILAINDKITGLVSISDAIKESSRQALANLRDLGIHIKMLTGDNEITARAVADEVGITDFKASCLPQDKRAEIIKLQEAGQSVAMAGDGINDAPALAQADIGIAMGTGTDVAMESADVTLVNGNLQGIVRAFRLSKKVMKNIRQNLFFALIYNTIGIPIAAGVLFPFFGILLSPMIAALAMSFSSVSVIMNSLRLRRVKL